MSFGGMFDGAAGSGVFSYDAGGGGGGGGGAGMHNQGRLIPAPPLPKPGGFGAPGLSLGLVDKPHHYSAMRCGVSDFFLVFLSSICQST